MEIIRLKNVNQVIKLITSKSQLPFFFYESKRLKNIILFSSGPSMLFIYIRIMVIYKIPLLKRVMMEARSNYTVSVLNVHKTE